MADRLTHFAAALVQPIRDDGTVSTASFMVLKSVLWAWGCKQPSQASWNAGVSRVLAEAADRLLKS
jgi:hypothetical protein